MKHSIKDKTPKEDKSKEKEVDFDVISTASSKTGSFDDMPSARF